MILERKPNGSIFCVRNAIAHIDAEEELAYHSEWNTYDDHRERYKQEVNFVTV